MDPRLGRGVSPLSSDVDEQVVALRKRYEAMRASDSSTATSTRMRVNAIEAEKRSFKYTRTPDERQWGRAVSPPGTHVATANSEVDHAISSPKNLWQRAMKKASLTAATVHFVIVPHGLLGTKAAKRKGGLARTVNVAALPDEHTCIVDAGINFTQGPKVAHPDSIPTYAFLGISDNDSFAPEVCETCTHEAHAKLHEYHLADESGDCAISCIHVVSPNFRSWYARLNGSNDQDVAAEATNALAEAYRAVFLEFNSCEANILRTVPISAGIFAGPFQQQFANLTMDALTTAFESLPEEIKRRLVQERQIHICLQNDALYSLFEGAGFETVARRPPASPPEEPAAPSGFKGLVLLLKQTALQEKEQEQQQQQDEH